MDRRKNKTQFLKRRYKDKIKTEAKQFQLKKQYFLKQVKKRKQKKIKNRLKKR